MVTKLSCFQVIILSRGECVHYCANAGELGLISTSFKPQRLQHG